MTTRSTTARRVSGAVLVAALALGVTAPAAVAGGKQLTRKQWVRAANTICSDADDRVSALTPPKADPTSDTPLTQAEFDEIEAYVEAAHDYSKDGLAELRALKPPKKDAAKVRKILTALKGSVGSINDALEATRDGDQEGIVTALTESEEAGVDFEAAAKAYGSTCGASGSA